MKKDNKSAKTIKLSVYFHTSGSGIKLEQKVAMKTGWVSMPTNHKHGIRASDVEPIYFGGSQGTLENAIKKCLKENKIKFIENESGYRKYQEIKEKEDFYDKELKL
jgi:hypothetical protein